MGYWDRMIGGQPRQQEQPASPDAQPAWWRGAPQPGTTPPTAPPQQAVAPQGYANPHGWAVDDVHNAGKDQALQARILNEGFIAKPPSWVRSQPTDSCPECSSPRFAQISGAGSNLNGRYGGAVTIGGADGVPMRQLIVKRCFDCGFCTTGATTDAMLGARVRSGAPVAGNTRQVASGGAVVNNYHGDDPTPDMPF